MAEIEFRFASEEDFKERMSICKKCIHFMKKVEQCDICLCIMPAKARDANAFCPIQKWTKIPPTN